MRHPKSFSLNPHTTTLYINVWLMCQCPCLVHSLIVAKSSRDLSQLLFVVTVWQSISMVVVEERVISVSPRKPLSSTSQMFEGNKLWSLVMLLMCLLLRSRVQVAQQHSRYGHRKWENLPQAQTALMMSRGCCCCRKFSKSRRPCDSQTTTGRHLVQLILNSNTG